MPPVFDSSEVILHVLRTLSFGIKWLPIAVLYDVKFGHCVNGYDIVIARPGTEIPAYENKSACDTVQRAPVLKFSSIHTAKFKAPHVTTPSLLVARGPVLWTQEIMPD